MAPALGNDEYTVGWITALALEAAAAEAVLDIEHEEPQWQHENDFNSYTLGSIGKHNVVIVSLPERYGPISAAMAVSQMLSTFKSIRIGLMVGIGGGIPNLEGGHDIRLGDVVVSRPDNTFGGVKQYDFGKRTAGGLFQPQGFLNSPPRILLNAVNKLKRMHLRRPSDVPNILREIEKSNPLMVEPKQGPSYLHQGPENDHLFQPTYKHKEGAKTCEECDKEQEIERPPRNDQDPFIHYGTIASGNQVIKDAETRDRLGKDCLCFEMEAAGLMNDFPCLVIRGICDYADSHKNKRWQNYAAVTAAAYAKELLQVTPVQGLKELPMAAGVMRKLQTIDENITKLTERVEAQHNQELLDWLSPLELSKRHYEIRSSRLPKSGMWILQHDSFLKWSSDSPASRALCCYGDPGAGKTFIASLVIDTLNESKDAEPNIGLAYVYCDYRDQIQQTTKNIIGAIIKQLLMQLPTTPEEITAIWQKHQKDKIPLELVEVNEALRITCKSFNRTYICLDALDECQSFQELLTFLQQAPSSIHLFSTGRNLVEPFFRKKFEHAYTIRIKAKDSDIQMLIQKYINEDREKDPDIMDKRLEQDVMTKISALSKGIFLLPVLQIRTVLDERSIRDREEALNTLPPNLEEAFGITIERIQRQPQAWAQQATKILIWINLAERPLSIDELLEACAIREDDHNLDTRGFPSRGTFLDCCLGLAVIEKETSTVRLVHFTLQEYFKTKDQILAQKIQEGHDAIARACLTYLMFRSVTTNTSPQALLDSNRSEAETRTPSYFLLDYAACQWGHHVRKSSCLQRSTIDATLKYLHMDLQGRMRSHSLLCRNLNIAHQDVRSFSIVHISAYFGIHQILLELLETDQVDIDSKDN
ncbi:purine and uridine phosphorylase, partial [Lepidopterella palustris CBS 459.81]